MGPTTAMGKMSQNLCPVHAVRNSAIELALVDLLLQPVRHQRRGVAIAEQEGREEEGHNDYEAPHGERPWQQHQQTSQKDANASQGADGRGHPQEERVGLLRIHSPRQTAATLRPVVVQPSQDQAEPECRGRDEQVNALHREHMTDT